ncbi:MAG: hypothetical protein GEV05_30220 [Betaproteobacteria bacterium]|nr:hypothetical protein [Betaproteobacteria bacterium]
MPPDHSKRSTSSSWDTALPRGAAIEASDADARVLLLEKMPDPGCAWPASTYARDDSWTDRLIENEVLEQDAALARLSERGLRWPSSGKEEFEIPALGKRLQRMLVEIRSGRGFVLIKCIPVDRYSSEELRNMYWVSGAHLGTVIHHVRVQPRGSPPHACCMQFGYNDSTRLT